MSDQIDVNQLSNALQQKVDLPSGKSQADIDYVIEWKAPTSSDPTWYRLYKSGWVEQGGRATANGSEQTVGVVLPVTMRDTNYYVSSSTMGFGSSYNDQAANTFELTVFNLSTTGFDVRIVGNVTNRRIRSWEVKGFAAQS